MHQKFLDRHLQQYFLCLHAKIGLQKLDFEPCKTKKSTCLLLFWITISFGGNALAVFWSSTRPTLHNQRERRDSTHALALKRASSNHTKHKTSVNYGYVNSKRIEQLHFFFVCLPCLVRKQRIILRLFGTKDYKK